MSYDFNIITDTVWKYGYTGKIESLSVPYSASYSLEVWDAQGGSYSELYHGEYGGYSYGIISLNAKDNLYITVGENNNSICESESCNGVFGVGGGGSGSGYIGSSKLKNKVMYCYKCGNVLDDDKKTISVGVGLDEAVSNTPKIGNGYAKISIILE